MANSILSAIEGLMRGICNQPVNRKSDQIKQKEIDYDKLKDIIVSAIEISEEKKQTRKDSASSVLGTLVAGMFCFSGALMIAVACLFVVGEFLFFLEADWDGLHIARNIIYIAVILFAVIAFSLLSKMCFCAASEISVENDRHYIAAVASALTSMVALLVALIALMK
ncbi:MAG: hypothetical protein J5531_04150 [Lachnospiraceae bacterium]|nr:hypothetical protein [Lachnospiraceae bacterium]